METPPFFDALREVGSLFGAAQVLALIEGAHDLGLLAELLEPQDVDSLASRVKADPQRIEAICRALETFEVVTGGSDTGWQLTPVWATFLRSEALIRLPEMLGLARVEGRLYRELGRGGTYWQLSSEDRVAYARGVSPNPCSAELVQAFRAAAEVDPDSLALQGGGDYLELGCGVAGRMLTLLQAFPELRGVGVELSADLAAEARRRARELGVADRIEVIEQDAGEFDRPVSFDFGFWSQFFFPTPARAGALRALFRALRPGGIAWAPLVTDFDAIEAEPFGADAREYAVRRILLQSWGIPERDFPALAAEFEAAGFVDVTRTGGGSQGPVRLRARRP